MERIRTLVFHPALTPYRLDLFNALADRLELRVVFMERGIRYDPNIDQQRLYRQLSCDYRVLKANLRIAGSDFRFGMGKEIGSFDPQVVVTHEFSYATFSSVVYRRFRAKKRFGLAVWTAENKMLLEERSLLRAFLLAAGTKLSDSIVVYSQPVLDELVAKIGLSSDKLFICANHQNESVFGPKLEEALLQARRNVREYCLEGKSVLLSMGRLSSEKNTAGTIAAFSRLAKRNPNFILVVVGDGPQKNELVSQAAELGVSDRIIFTGHLTGPDLFAWLNLASLFVLSSVVEPYGAVVCEALLSGIPVICSSAAGASVLIEEGKNGRVFDPLDIETLAVLMEKELAGKTTAGELIGKRRKSLMPVPFEREVSSFVAAVEHAFLVR